MAHATSRGAYEALTERLNRFPQGAPASELLFRILAMLFSEREAGLVARLPIRPFTAQRAARIWGMGEAEARGVLDGLASRAILIDVEGPTGTVYALPPPMAGFFEFSMMRVRDDVDQRLLAELFNQYITVEDDFILALFTNGETQLGRVFVNEPALAEARPAGGDARDDGVLQVLDHERASEVVQTARHMGVGVCYCRHKAEHVGRACAAPKNICMTFGGTADSLIRHGYARRVEPAEGMDLLEEAHANRLVQFGENVQRYVAFICNCCGCCCEAMIAARRFGRLNPVHTTNYLPHVDAEACNGCAKCVDACPVEAMTVVSANDPHKPRKRRAEVDASLCLGCGVCTGVCPKAALWLEPRPDRVITPVDTLHRTVLMAIERGRLADCIFDNRALFSHRAMAGVLGVILRLPPTKQILASEQMRSRYLARLLERVKVYQRWPAVPGLVGPADGTGDQGAPRTRVGPTWFAYHGRSWTSDHRRSRVEVSIDVVGRLARVTADITPGHLGEVLIEVRQGTERFLARASDSTATIPKHTQVLVVGSLGGRTVEVEPADSMRLPQ